MPVILDIQASKREGGEKSSELTEEQGNLTRPSGISSTQVSIKTDTRAKDLAYSSIPPHLEEIRQKAWLAMGLST